MYRQPTPLLLSLLARLSQSLASGDESGAPVEISPEMIAAGVRVLCGYETFTADEAYWAREVYLAMRTASVPK